MKFPLDILLLKKCGNITWKTTIHFLKFAKYTFLTLFALYFWFVTYKAVGIGIFCETLRNNYELCPNWFNAHNVGLYDDKGNMLISGGVGWYLDTKIAVYGQIHGNNDYEWFYVDKTMKEPRYFISLTEFSAFTNESNLTPVNSFYGKRYE